MYCKKSLVLNLNLNWLVVFSYPCDGRLLLVVVVKKLKVVNWPVNVVQYCKHPGGGLESNNTLECQGSGCSRVYRAPMQGNGNSKRHKKEKALKFRLELQYFHVYWKLIVGSNEIGQWAILQAYKTNKIVPRGQNVINIYIHIL